MKSITKSGSILLGILFVLLSSACQLLNDEKQNKETNRDGYYSISGFLDDQWELLHGQPILLLRVATFNGKTDSSYIPLDTALWESIREQFDPSDISDTKFIDQYTFTHFNESTTNTDYYHYEANDKKFFTQSVYLGADDYNNKIKSIFIQTQKRGRAHEKSQKLTYIPRKFITIQTFEKSFFSKAENLQITYYFEF